MKSAPNARARFSCGKENNCLSEGLYTKERFCYDKENQQLQTKMSTENPGQTVVECGKAAGYIKMVGKKMYRVSKVLNNNGIIAINMEENQEYVLLGKGVGFGKKVSQRFEAPADCTLYRLAQETERGSAKELAKSVAPEFLEIADEILREAEKTFGNTIDRRILFPLADHISFAVGRIRNHEQISNPLTEDAFAGKTMDRMSDGECQRVMIARALAQDTPIILLDEPTSFLDLPNRYELASLLRRLAHEEGKCIFFSTHDLDVALGLCDATALIDTPTLHCMSAADMAASGHIERLFAGAGISFDPATLTIRLAKK